MRASPSLAIEWGDLDGIILVIAVLAAVYAVFRALFPRLARAAILRGASSADEEMEKRARTIIGVVERSAGLAFLIVAAVTVLDEAGVEITAIITGLGITGLAIALGSQTLVRDAINGIFLLAEDQYRVGDVVRVADVTGRVESLSLRRTIIRDDDGVVHSVPNGSINVVSNFTRDFARVNLQVQVAYGEDLSKVNAVIERVGRELAADDQFGPMVTEPAAASRVDSVGEGGVTLSVRVETRPSAREEVAAELRRRLLEAFVADGIRVPFSTWPQDQSGDEGSRPSSGIGSRRASRRS